MNTRWQSRSAFTLVELLAVVAVLAMLAVVLGVSVRGLTQRANEATSANNLRQLSQATMLYTQEHNGRYFPVVERGPDGSRRWWFGLETRSGGGGEGNRELLKEGGLLSPYIGLTGGINRCPGYSWDSPHHKPKWAGASFGYGYNALLSGRRVAQVRHPARTVLFATCAQVNTWQQPATPSNPMVEEFYWIDQRETSVDFRFGGGERALVVFTDGNIDALPPHPGTTDNRVPGVSIGRLAPRGSFEYLWYIP